MGCLLLHGVGKRYCFLHPVPGRHHSPEWRVGPLPPDKSGLILFVRGSPQGPWSVSLSASSLKAKPPVSDWLENFSSRLDRNGMTVKCSKVLRVASRKLRERLRAQDTLHLCRDADCSHGAALHCDTHLHPSAWRFGVLFCRGSRRARGLLFRLIETLVQHCYQCPES